MAILFDIKVEENCPICHEKLESKDVHVTGCKHSFHKTCMDSWLELNNSCPMCRAPIKFGEKTDDQINNDLSAIFWSGRTGWNDRFPPP